MDRMTQAKIDSLLFELRLWNDERRREGVAISLLARRFQLDPLVVRRLAENEGIRVLDAENDEGVDPNRATRSLPKIELASECCS